jgi:hypothetical protein
MKEEIWAGVVAFLGALGLMLKFWKNGKAEEKKNSVPSDQSNRLTAVETEVSGLKESVGRIEGNQETQRREVRQDIGAVHKKIDGVDDKIDALMPILLEIKANGSGRR